MIIVYQSNAGHTKRYAEMLGKKLKVNAVDIKKYKASNEKVIYLGWVFGSMIMGYNKIKKDNLVCTAAVGMSYDSPENTNKIIETNKIEGKFFYLQGGIDYKSLKGIKKLMIKIVSKSVKKDPAVDSKTKELFDNSKDFVKEENLKSILAYLKTVKDR